MSTLNATKEPAKKLERKMERIFNRNQNRPASTDDIFKAGDVAVKALELAGPEFAGIANLLDCILCEGY